jgi:hypothetical protein
MTFRTGTRRATQPVANLAFQATKQIKLSTTPSLYVVRLYILRYAHPIELSTQAPKNVWFRSGPPLHPATLPTPSAPLRPPSHLPVEAQRNHNPHSTRISRGYLKGCQRLPPLTTTNRFQTPTDLSPRLFLSSPRHDDPHHPLRLDLPPRLLPPPYYPLYCGCGCDRQRAS